MTRTSNKEPKEEPFSLSGLKETLAHPLPNLSVHAGETSSGDFSVPSAAPGETVERLFTLTNTGGGQPEGRVFATVPDLSFAPASFGAGDWVGNRCTIRCFFTPDPSRKPGDVVDTAVVFLTNGTDGGEEVVPLTLKVVRASGDVGKVPADPLVADLSLPTDSVHHTRKIGDNSMVYGHFWVTRDENGRVPEPKISKLHGAPWLFLAKQRLHAGDFEENEAEVGELFSAPPRSAMVKYSIDPLRIAARYARETVLIETNTQTLAVTLEFFRPAPLCAWLSKEGYLLPDEGAVILQNQSLDVMAIEVFCKEPFVRFPYVKNQRYRLEGTMQIPFSLKTSPLQAAQMALRKQPALSAVIEVKAFFRDEIIKHHLPFVAGHWNANMS